MLRFFRRCFLCPFFFFLITDDSGTASLLVAWAAFIEVCKRLIDAIRASRSSSVPRTSLLERLRDWESFAGASPSKVGRHIHARNWAC